MISCTEFIPAYSELFTYLERHYGEKEVERYWNHCFQPAPGSDTILGSHIRRSGLRGCFDYWAWSLNEEAADFTMYLNEPAGWFLIKMHHCPSKGRLLDLKASCGLEPYSRYCLHCDGYRYSVEPFGLKYLYDYCDAGQAACSVLVYDPERFNGRILPDAHTEIMDRRAAQNEYLHRQFHNGVDQAVSYLGSHFGEASVIDYLQTFARHFYHNLENQIRENGLSAMKAHLERIYALEHASDVLSVQLSDQSLQVQISRCPAVTYMRRVSHIPSPWYGLTTRIVMETIAADTGYTFTMDAYDEETGAASYAFHRSAGTGELFFPEFTTT